MAFTAAELGHDYLVLTDHSPRLKVARGLGAERLARQLEVVAASTSTSAGERAFTAAGRHRGRHPRRRVARPDRRDAARLDVRVASVHSKLRMEAGPMTRRMVAAVRNPLINVLGHCTGRMVKGNRGTRTQSEFDARAVFEACAEHGTAVEINSRPERRDPPTALLELARDVGCLFSIDSDAHAPGQLDLLDHGCERAELAGIDPDRIVNTWPRERLLAWAND